MLGIKKIDVCGSAALILILSLAVHKNSPTFFNVGVSHEQFNQGYDMISQSWAL